MPLREPQGPEATPEKLEAERQAAQDFIDNGAVSRFFKYFLNRSWQSYTGVFSHPVEPLTEDLVEWAIALHGMYESHLSKFCNLFIFLISMNMT